MLMPTIKILETDPNKQGDLFGRLMGDLFLALGYERVRLNIHKSGREIDIEASHRTEHRRVIAECKATQEKTGGNEINKFIGSLDAEKRKSRRRNIIGYFISLAGFRETTIEQERDLGSSRVILLDATRVVQELINGHILVSLERAMERAGRCVTENVGAVIPESCELLAHSIGWIWAIYFSQNKQKTHFALIHADGEAIAPALAELVIHSDTLAGGCLHSITYLSPSSEPSIPDNRIAQARTQYFDYLKSECGEIQLEGLPADQEVGSRRLNLENLFVPMHLVPVPERQNAGAVAPADIEDPSESEKERKSVGQILNECTRLAILASPGGGKSTLIKRLAVAYAFPPRRALIDDALPDRVYLPLFIRCRHLSVLAKSPIKDILNTIPQRAELGEEQKQPFAALVNKALQNGEALLLVDGLDEISDESTRVAFVHQFRTFLATYPSVSVVVTSREAGFRIVGGELSSVCMHYRLADFNSEDIKRLTSAWHKEVVGDKPEVLQEAEQLAITIIDSDRLQRLARNPLLLTTLLLVKRWVGQLPTRRSVLYGKAIEVLLMTWNVEAYQPIDQDEAIPQLAFIAFTMMKEGVQRVSSRRLREILTSARAQMPEVLAFARISVSEFIERVESRSSLLMLSGYEIERGTLYPMYEFRHLTFQEYLTARAIVDGYYPNRKDKDDLVTLLRSHIKEQRWAEVVPLTAVLAGRRVQPLIQHLIDLSKDSANVAHLSDVNPARLLGQCIVDEIQVPPELLETALEWVARRVDDVDHEIILNLLKSKYGKILIRVARETFAKSETDLLALGSTLGSITLYEVGYLQREPLTPDIVAKLQSLLKDEIPIKKAGAALAIMELAFFSRWPREESRLSPVAKEHLKLLGDSLVPILFSDQVWLFFAAAWAFAWIGATDTWTPEQRPDVLLRLLNIWQRSRLPEVQYVASWAIESLPIIDRHLNPFGQPSSALIKFIEKEVSSKEHPLTQWSRRGTSNKAALAIAFYLQKPWTDESLAQLAAELFSDTPYENVFSSRLLRALGEPGHVQLEILKRKRATREGQSAKQRRKR